MSAWAAAVRPRVRAWPAVVSWTAGGLVLALAGGFYSITTGVSMWDESWFLDVVASGKVLYRDVFFPATPVSVYVTRAATAIGGEQMLVQRIVGVACFVAMGLITCLVCRQVGLRGRVLVPVGIAFFVLSPPPAGPALYSSFGWLFFLACLSATLSSKPWSVAVAGVFAGLSFASKQTVGACAIAALVVALLARARGLRACAIAVGAFAAAVLVVLAPTLLSGGATRLVDYGLFGQGEYLHVGPASWTHALGTTLDRLSPLSVNGVRMTAKLLPTLLLPVVAAVAWAAMWLRGRRESRSLLLVLGVFGVADVAGAYPRFNEGHLINTVGPLLVVCVLAIAELGRQRLAAAGVVCAVLAAVNILGLHVQAVTQHQLRAARLPHFHDVYFPQHQRPDLRGIAELESAVGRGPVFIVSPEAGFYYLVTGVRNPTPYDFASLPSMGRHGARDVIREIERGAIRTACVAPASVWIPAQPIRPLALEAAVRGSMHRGPNLGFCTLYRR